MIIIQFVLIAAVLLLLVFFLRSHGTSRAAASVKIGFVLFLLFAVIAVLYPDSITKVARLVGVGRGTDLVLYLMVVGFAFAMINTYLRFRDMSFRYARLARALALRDAEPPADEKSEAA
jgi:hypothetical protein